MCLPVPHGAHGTSHKFVAGEAAKYLNKKPEQLKIITCHLGNGSSISAVDGGKCVDTSMGFTPLAGGPMGTRSGDIDFAAVEYLCMKKGMSLEEGLAYLNKKCGMLGVSGVSSDFRDLSAAAKMKYIRLQIHLTICWIKLNRLWNVRNNSRRTRRTNCVPQWRLFCPSASI